MEIYPALDLRLGKCVRLFQGDFDQQTIYNADPLAVANEFKADGATWLHLIDLDAAKDPTQRQISLLHDVINALDLNIQVGGGIREKEQVIDLLDKGVKRVIIGSLAAQQADMVESWLNEFGPDRIVIALDVLIQDDEAFVVTEAWQTVSELTLFELLHRFDKVGLKHVLCTDIQRDGILSGPNFELYEKVLKEFPTIQLQASGGVSGIEDIKKLKKTKISGVVLGRSLYEKQVTLPEVLEEAKC